MDKIRITFIFALTCLIIIGTTCLAATGIVNAPSGLVLRETASKGAKPLTTVPDDAEVEIIEKAGEWYKVKYKNYEGYLFAEYVNEKEETTTPEEIKEETTEEIQPSNLEEQVTETNKTVILNNEVKAYLFPSITAKVIKTLGKEKTITINCELNKWYNITYEGKDYWVRKFYIENIISNLNENKPVAEGTQQKEASKTVEQELIIKKGM